MTCQFFAHIIIIESQGSPRGPHFFVNKQVKEQCLERPEAWGLGAGKSFIPALPITHIRCTLKYMHTCVHTRAHTHTHVFSPQTGTPQAMSFQSFFHSASHQNPLSCHCSSEAGSLSRLTLPEPA